MKTSKIPLTDSIEELARFWDAHDLTDFEGELEEVDAVVFDRGPGTVVRVPLGTEEVEAVRQAARSRGVKEAALLREWVLEGLRAGT